MSEIEATGAREKVWMRGLFMLVFIVLFGVGQWLLNLIAVIQFVWMLATGRSNPQLTGFGRSLAVWLADVARFQSCASEERPFPWTAWPSPV
jgi:hypothetical protein